MTKIIDYKLIARIIGFILIFGILFVGIQNVFQAEWPDAMNSYARVKLFYAEEPSPDVVFVGSSHVFEHINPLVIYKDYGIVSYDFSPPVLGMEATELYVEETLKTCTPDVIAIDASRLFLPSMEESRSRQWLDPLPLSRGKIDTAKYILELVDRYGSEDEYDSLLSYVFPLLRYHTRWIELTEGDWELGPDLPYYHGTEHYHGYGAHYVSVPAEFGHYYDDVSVDQEIAAEAKGFFGDIVSLCKAKNVKVLLLKTPTISWRKGFHDVIAEWAEEYEVPFLDCCEKLEEIGIDAERDFRQSGGGHMNDYGVTKTSHYIGEYLKQNYDLPDHRNDPAYASWEDDWQVYQQDKASYELHSETDWTAYLQKLQNPNYTVFMAARDSLGGNKYPELTEQFKSIGLTPELDTAARVGYLAVIDGGEIVYEHLEDVPLTWEADINGHHVEMVSESWNLGNRASIQFDWKERSLNRRGINILVYDNILEVVVDSVTFDLFDGGKAYR